MNILPFSFLLRIYAVHNKSKMIANNRWHNKNRLKIHMLKIGGGTTFAKKTEK
jgi:deferrochelatase/peroxidase EfeB